MKMRPPSAPRPLRFLGATLALGILAGCANHAFQKPQVDEERVKQVAGKGYSSDAHFSIATTHHSWAAGDFTFDISLTMPAADSALPLVIYLPGLGETRSAGEAWRTAWAQAGYGVLAVQPLGDDQQAWSSTAARQGNFDTLARERYSIAAASARLKALAALMSEIARRRSAGDAALGKLDVSRVAVAGYDVGAFSAMLAAGEVPKAGFAPSPLPLPVSATVALSPYADFSGSGFATRYQAITGPVLSVSGDGDADALGAVTSPAVRKAPFENMPSKEAYLLWLANAGHGVMSGGPATAAEESGSRQHGDGAAEHSGGSRRGSRGQGKNSRGAGSDQAGGESGGRLGGMGMPLSPTDRAIDVKLIQGVTTAFLDAYVKKDPVAAEWLQKDARRWIGERGLWQRK